jgi:hypothetical protein
MPMGILVGQTRVFGWQTPGETLSREARGSGKIGTERMRKVLMDILDAWLHHWGWLWMVVGLCGFVVVAAVSNN